MTDDVEFREGVAADMDSVLALRRLAFPESSPDLLRTDFWAWKFIDGYAGPALFFVAEANGQVVGHLALIPQKYATPDPIVGGLTVDAMVHPDFRSRHVYSRLVAFAGKSVSQKFRVSTAFQIRPHVMAGAVSSGWQHAMDVPVLVRTLSLRGLAHDLGLPVSPPVARAEGTGRIVRATGETESTTGETESIRAVSTEDLGQIAALLTAPALRQPRSVDFLKWRYRRNPAWKYEIDGFFDGDDLLAFVVHRELPLRGIQTLAFVDAGFRPGSDDAFRILIRHLLRRGSRRGLGLAAALLSDGHPAYRAIRRRGFVRGPHRFRFLIHIPDTSSGDIHGRPWSLSWGDSDHL